MGLDSAPSIVNFSVISRNWGAVEVDIEVAQDLVQRGSRCVSGKSYRHLEAKDVPFGDGVRERGGLEFSRGI